jgi:hypothetical protein
MGVLVAVMSGGIRLRSSEPSNLREDEILCEEAVARLVECCPQIDPSSINCSYVEKCIPLDEGDGCSAGAEWLSCVPQIDQGDSVAWRDASCAEVRAHGWCEPGAWGGLP